MPFLKIHTQFVWNSKNEISFLALKEVRKIIWNHIKTNSQKNGVRLNFINGYSDFYHCVVALEAGQTIEHVMETLNEDYPFWIDKKGISTEIFPSGLPPFFDGETNNKFDWEDNYFALAVSESVFERVSNYTLNLLADNNKKLFDKEYNEYVIQYGFQKFSDE